MQCFGQSYEGLRLLKTFALHQGDEIYVKRCFTEEESYSRTNVQTAGVDESDIVKTDGSYIYVVHDDAVEIIDVRGKAMKAAGEIEISMDSATDQVLEMYVDGDVLNLIVQKEKADLKESDGTEEQEANKRAYYIETSVETELFTYDIKNRRNPVFSGSIKIGRAHV